MARKRDKRRRKGQQKRKISEMIWEFAGDFIRMAETPQVQDRRMKQFHRLLGLGPKGLPFQELAVAKIET